MCSHTAFLLINSNYLDIEYLNTTSDMLDDI